MLQLLTRNDWWYFFISEFQSNQLHALADIVTADVLTTEEVANLFHSCNILKI